MFWATPNNLEEYERAANRRKIRREFKVPDTVPVYATYSVTEPTLCGERAGWFTRSGRRIDSPRHYSNENLEYRQSTQVIKLPIRYEGTV